MDRLQRIYKLHQAVSSRRHPVSCQTLQNELECSRATVNRIIQEMRLYFNAPIEYDRQRNGYLDAYCHTRNALRSFAVERITAAKALPQRCRDAPEKQLDAHYVSSYGIFAGKPKHTAVLRFTPERVRWVADEHWHPQQQSQWLGNGSYELRIPYSDPRELVMDILKHGAEVKVIEPEELRCEVMKHLRQAAAKYTSRKVIT